MSTLLEQWRDTAYSKEMDKASLQKFWGTYFQTEKEIYEKLLENPDEEVKGTVKELAEKYGINVFTMTGFLDGINDSLKVANPIETMDEDTEVSLAFDKELLTGCMNCHSGIRFLQKKRKKSFTKNRKTHVQST